MSSKAPAPSQTSVNAESSDLLQHKEESKTSELLTEHQSLIPQRRSTQQSSHAPPILHEACHSGVPTGIGLQPKLTIGRVGDRYEQEADRVASDVVHRLNRPQSRLSPSQSEGATIQRSPNISSIQRQEVPEEEKEETVQQSPDPNFIQRQEAPEDEDEETIQQSPDPNFIQRQETPEEDKEEEETIQRSPDLNLIQRQETPEDEDKEEETVQQSPDPNLVQRQETPEDEEEETVQRATVQNQPKSNTSSTSLSTSIKQARSSGQSLPVPFRRSMEQAFSADFRSVKIHTDSRADQLNRSIHAQAFTTQQDIFFRQGAYDPHSQTGQELVAHELTHVVQQTGRGAPHPSAPMVQAKRLSDRPVRLRRNKLRTPEEEERKKKQQDAEQSEEQTTSLTQPRSDVAEFPQTGVDSQSEAPKGLAEPSPKERPSPLVAKTLESPKETSLKTQLRNPETLKESSIATSPTTLKTIPTAKAPPEAKQIIPDIKQVAPRTATKDTALPQQPAVSQTPKSLPTQETALKPTPLEKPAISENLNAVGTVPEAPIATLEGIGQPTPSPTSSTTPDVPPIEAGKSVSTEQKAPQPEVAPPPTAQPSPTEALPGMPPTVEAGAVPTGAAALTAEPEAAAPVATESEGGGGEDATANAAEDQELAEVANATQGVSLEESDRSDATSSLGEVAEAGGEAPAPSGGGGGGTAIPDEPAPDVPDVSQADPAQALASVSQLPPAQLQVALGSVTSSVNNTVGKQRSELAANPPQMERPSGSPMTSQGSVGDKPLPASTSPKSVEKAPQGQSQPVPQPKPLPPLPPPPTQAISRPALPENPEGKLSSDGAQALQASISRLPTSDPSLTISAGAPPKLELVGDANPQQADAQRAKLDQSIAENQTQGARDAAQPMGENEIYPNVPPETLRAEGIGEAGGGASAPQAAGGAAGGAAEGAAGDKAESIIAQQEHGAEIQAGVAQAQQSMATEKQGHATKVADEKASFQQNVTTLKTENAALQAQERSNAQAEVQKHRQDWSQEQTDLVDRSQQDADSKVSDGMTEVEQKQTDAETKAAEHVEQGDKDADAAREKGEADAAREQRRGEQESSGIFDWFADKAKAFFDGIKAGIQKAFEVARAAVKAAIEKAKKLATEAIEAARKAVVDIIHKVGDALIAIGNVVLSQFPELKKRFQDKIRSVVQSAEQAVNKFADDLKKDVVAALNLLGKGLDAALGLLEKGLLAAVDIANKAVQGAISLAKKAAQALGVFAALIKDVARSPGQWLKNLAAGVMDGIRNHLWNAFQTAVKEWFNQKVEEVLGLGAAIWKILTQGGINLAEVGKMAWEGIKAAIPPALIQILIEKLVAMIVPAAGAVLAVIEGLQAAWGTVNRILQAMEKFIAFLKAVKSGTSGPQFGSLLAAAGIILIDFVANWLLKRVRKAGSKIAGKIRAIAQKIGQKLRKVVKKLKRKLKKLGNKLKKKFSKLKDKFFGKKGKKSKKSKKDKKDAKDEKKKQKALNKAIALVNKIISNRNITRDQVEARLPEIKAKYHLTELRLVPDSESTYHVHGEINPRKNSRKKSDKGKSGNGPYSYLKSEDPPNVAAGKNFTTAQKARIIAENRKRNKDENGIGRVTSDDSGKQLVIPKKSKKGVAPLPHEWQIDHIIPRDRGGNNSYANAQVLSRRENRSKSNK
jgi:hypothetical protein